MTLEEFINEILCLAGVVTAWDDIIINTAFLLDDMETITSKVVELAAKAGVEVPFDLILNNDNSQNT